MNILCDRFSVGAHRPKGKFDVILDKLDLWVDICQVRYAWKHKRNVKKSSSAKEMETMKKRQIFDLGSKNCMK
jgi:hypothetical protein